MFSYTVIHQTTQFFLSEDIIKLVINFLIKSGRFDRPLIRFNRWMCFRYISFHLFVLSNSVKYNSCKFSVAYVAGSKSNTYYSFKFIFFLFKFKSCFSILLFVANNKAKKHYMSSAASTESVYLNWILSLIIIFFI